MQNQHGICSFVTKLFAYTRGEVSVIDNTLKATHNTCHITLGRGPIVPLKKTFLAMKEICECGGPFYSPTLSNSIKGLEVTHT